MKKFWKRIAILFAMNIFMITNTYSMSFASEIFVADDINEPSELLPKEIKENKVSEKSVRRGEFFAEADLMITDQGDGNIGALAKAYMDRAVDEVYITIYLDRWNEEEERWQMVTYYDAEFYAEDYPEGLTDPTVDITFLNQERGHYYRLRSAFSAVYDDDYEGFSPTTSGIWIE